MPGGVSGSLDDDVWLWLASAPPDGVEDLQDRLAAMLAGVDAGELERTRAAVARLESEWEAFARALQRLRELKRVVASR